uniref:Gypsy retrotransposon integrase-like protein 1 n=3 Tax=Nothobranchius furzeri TaxID=105023 RepID=A0A8C6L5X0_NOTFU
MQLGRSQLSPEEKTRRRNLNLCLYCGNLGHMVPIKRIDPVDIQRRLLGHINPKSSPRPPVTAIFSYANQETKLPVFIDSDTDTEFIDYNTAKTLGLELQPVSGTQEILAIDGHTMYRAIQETEPLNMRIEGNHRETLKFLFIKSPSIPIILGNTWLQKHNPQIDWCNGKVLQWSAYCHHNCLNYASPPTQSVQDPQEIYPDLCKVPKTYHDLKEVFSKHRATSLAPHHPDDCAIDLLPGTFPPRSHLFSLSIPEQTAMTKYVKESLQAGLIRPSSSPAGAGFFFVERKDGSLRPCINYRGLNDITVKNRYPLPLINTAFDSLHGARIFTKLDLRNAYHLVRIREGDEWKTAFNTPTGHYEYLVMPFGLTNAPAVFQTLINDVLRDIVGSCVFIYLDDVLVFSTDPETHQKHVHVVLLRLLQNNLFVKAEKCEFHCTTVSLLGFTISPNQIAMDPAKTSAVVNWPVPTTRKQLQRFLGFANFYRRFIKGYSKITTPRHALTSSKVSFQWNKSAQDSFQKLKDMFTSAPVLHLPDTTRQFIVEVDASAFGVGAVLSQRSKDDKVHPCAFFSKTLSSTERNYDVGDRELLAIKLALEEWRHWLEGVVTPFIVWTDHKNLEYIKTAKRLNSRQARWAIFFTRFNFTLSYRPGEKNTKPDALSRSMEPTITDQDHDSDSLILPQRVLLGASRLELENQLRQAHQQYPVPPRCPPDCLFIPDALRSQVLTFCHSSRLYCHPGVSKTLALVHNNFWSTLSSDVKEYVSACPTCAKVKSSR